MAALVSTRRPVIRPFALSAIAQWVEWSRPCASVRFVSVRVAAHFTGRSSFIEHRPTIASSA